MFGITVTLDSLIDDTINRLQGFGVNNDQFSTLAEDMSPTDTSFRVTDPGRISQGIVEIGTELVLVSTVGETSGVIARRGYRGTVASSHQAGEPVLMRPTYPRAVVAREINLTLASIYPALYGVKQVELDADPVTWQYGLPADTARVLLVEVNNSAVEGWNIVEDWDVRHGANPTSFPTGIALNVRTPQLGKLRVWYASRPGQFAALSDEWTLTGLPESCRDVVILGTAVRLIPWLDTGRLPVEAAEADAADNARQLGTALSAAKALKADYAEALNRERTALEQKYPPRARGVR